MTQTEPKSLPDHAGDSLAVELIRSGEILEDTYPLSKEVRQAIAHDARKAATALEASEREKAFLAKQLDECQMGYGGTAQVKALRTRISELEKAGQDLIDDVKRRYPGEALRCPYMIALDAALARTTLRNKGNRE